MPKNKVVKDFITNATVGYTEDSLSFTTARSNPKAILSFLDLDLSCKWVSFGVKQIRHRKTYRTWLLKRLKPLFLYIPEDNTIFRVSQVASINNDVLIAGSNVSATLVCYPATNFDVIKDANQRRKS